MKPLNLAREAVPGEIIPNGLIYLIFYKSCNKLYIR